MSLIEVSAEAWRRPIVASAEETYDGIDRALFEGRGVRWFITGPDAMDDVRRMQLGLACVKCLEVFPARPEMQSLPVLMAEMNFPGRLRDVARSRIAMGCCPTCGCEVSPELTSVELEG